MRCSVVIPLHDAAPYAARAVGSVLAQRVDAAEVIVVDDGSTDDGAALLRRSFPAITVIEQHNRGPGPARNTGIAAASGDWIAFLDADDAWLPWHLDQLAAAARRFPEVRVVAGAFVPLRPDQPIPRLVGGRAQRIDYFCEAARDIGVVHSSTVAVHRSAFEQVGDFGTAPRGQDLEMWARLALAVPIASTSVTSAVYTLGVGLTAAFERDAASRPLPPAPTSLRDLSPSARVVADALESGDHLPPARSLRRYLDSRLAWTMRNRIAAGDIDGARALRSLATSRAWPENIAPMTASALPSAVLRSLLNTKRWGARRVRSIRP